MNNYFIPEKNEINNKVDLVLYFTLLGYIISLFLKDAPVITNILMAFILLLSLLSVSPVNYLPRLLNNRICLGIVIFYLYQIISVLLSDDIRSGFSILILRLPLLILPLSFCFINFDKKIWDKILLFYAIATVFATIIGFVFGIYRMILENDSGNLYNDNISEIVGKQAVYFALYVGVAILILLIQLKEYPPSIQKYNWLIYLAIIWLLFIIFMLASRTAMFGLLLIIVIYVLKTSIEKRKIMELALLFLSLVIISVVLMKAFPKTLNKFTGTTDTDFQYDNKNVENHFNAEYDSAKWNGTNTRLAIWNCAIEIWKEQPIMGTGLGDRDKTLMNKYEEKGFWYGLNTQKNTHNQYLSILMSMGVVGFILFVTLFFIYPMKFFFKNKQTLAITTFALLAICFFTETMLGRYQGLIFISFILPLVSIIGNEKFGDNNCC